jgi:hypothetical protein
MIRHILARIRWNGLSPLHKRRHINRIIVMLSALMVRFAHLKHPEQMQLKHARWLAEVWLVNRGLADATQTDYRRSMALLVGALDGNHHWQSALKMARDPKKGGRPETCKATKTRRRR